MRETKIASNRAYYETMAKLETLLEKGFERLNEAETRHLKELSDAVEAYEMSRYPMPVKSSLESLLRSVMYENNLNKTELARMLEIPNSTLSGLLSGKRKINIGLARKMHEKFKIDGNLLLEVS